jgi:Fe-S-cluster containining protein
MTDTSFYTSGLKFSCKRCSTCCRYDSGFVYLSAKDLEKLILELKMDRSSFIKKFCRWVMALNGNEVLSLKEKSNKDCILWNSGCLVYLARPLQCRTFPFWENIISSYKAWKVAASGCLGMDSGKLHTENDINHYIKQRATEPIINRTGRGI